MEQFVTNQWITHRASLHSTDYNQIINNSLFSLAFGYLTFLQRLSLGKFNHKMKGDIDIKKTHNLAHKHVMERSPWYEGQLSKQEEFEK